MARLLRKRRARKQAEELAKKTALEELRSKNRAKREAKKADMAAIGKAKRANPGSSGLASAEESAKEAAKMKTFREESKAAEVRTKIGRSNIKARREAQPGEAYKRTEATGKVSVKRKSDPSKKNQPKPVVQQSPAKVKSNKEEVGEHSRTQYGKEKKTYTSKPGESLVAFKKRIKPDLEKNKAKHGGALAIMIAPVKTKKMKAVKKAPDGAAMKKMPEYKKGGALKSVPSKAKGLSKLPKDVRNKMGYAKHGSKVKAMYGAKMKKK